MLASINPHKEDGIVRPRVVAHSLQIAKLLADQKQQAIGSGNLATVPYALDGFIVGGVLYFMIDRIAHCQGTHACDPSRAALFHWFDDTMRRTESFLHSPSQLEELKNERGSLVTWLEKQDRQSFLRCAEVLQVISPYDFAVFSVPYEEKLTVEHVQLLDQERYFSLLRHLLEQYLTVGMDYMKRYQESGQLFEMRLFMRHLTTMRTIARGFGNAALLSHDYRAVAESFYFSGDLMDPSIQRQLKDFLTTAQNEYPDTCEKVLQAIDTAKTDWFDKFKTIYQISSSPSAATSSVH